jgi:hypothetical protein
MALVLMLAGLVVVRLSGRIQDRLAHSEHWSVLRIIPVLTAGAVIVLGTLLLLRGLVEALRAA